MNHIVNRRKDNWLQLRGGKRDARMEHKSPFIECDTPSGICSCHVDGEYMHPI
jgi:hypothetical protein